MEDPTGQNTQAANTQAAAAQTTIAGGVGDEAVLSQAASAVGYDWEPGQRILGVYAVQKVVEGFGENAEQKNYHEGGFGRVYKVRHLGWNQDLAVKTPRREKFVTPQQKEAFTHECVAWMNLGYHPHLAVCHYVRELGGVPRVFAEYAEAGTLHDWIKYGRLYDGSERTILLRILDIAIQFAWGLHAAHEAKLAGEREGLIHKDVKPLNLLMWNTGTAKVSDFGLAGARQKAEEAALPTQSGGGGTLMATGGDFNTPGYRSPEQAAGRDLTRRTDVWSWAVSVLEMFEGAPPCPHGGQFAATYLKAYRERYREGGARELDYNIPVMPDALAELLERCFREDPDERPRTMFECAKAVVSVYAAVASENYPRPEAESARETADILNNRALSYLDLGDQKRAEEFFDRALKIDAHHVCATYNQGLVLWRDHRKSCSDLLRDLEVISQERPDDWQVRLAVGWVNIENFDFATAYDSFSAATTLGGKMEARSALDLTRPLAESSRGMPRTVGKHSAEVTSVALSPNRRFAASGSADRTLMLWEVASGRCLNTLAGHYDGVTSVVFSPDGRFLLSGSSDSTLKLWERDTGRCLQTFEGHNDAVNSVTFDPKGHFALSGSSDNTLKLWDLKTGNCHRTFVGHSDRPPSIMNPNEGPAARGAISSVAFSSDARFVLSGSHDWSVKLWEVETGRCIRTLYESGYNSPIYQVGFTPDGRFALAASGGSKRWPEVFLWRWDLVTGSWERTRNWISLKCVAFSPDGQLALSGGRLTSESKVPAIRLADFASWRFHRSFVGHSGDVTAIAFSADGRFALSGSSDRTVMAWHIGEKIAAPVLYSVTTPTSDVLLRQTEHTRALAEAKAAFAQGDDATALSQLKKARSVPGFGKTSEAMALQRRLGTRLRIKSYREAWLSRTFEGHTYYVNTVAFSPDGRFVASGSHDKTIRLWEVTTGHCLRSFEGHTGSVSSVAFSPCGRMVLSADQGEYGGAWRKSEEYPLRLWEVETGRCIRTFHGHKDGVYCVGFSPDGRYALSGGLGGALNLWTVSNGKRVRAFEGNDKTVQSLAFSPDGRLAVSSGNGNTLHLWDVEKANCVRKFDGHGEDAVVQVAFSPNGRFVLSGGGRTNNYGEGVDHTIKLWDVSDGRCVRTFEERTQQVLSLAFSPDWRFAISGTGGKIVKLWNVETGRCLRTLDGHKEGWNSMCVTFSPDGGFALSGNGDKTLMLWELDWEYEFDPEMQRERQEAQRSRAAEPTPNRSLRDRIANLFSGRDRTH